MIPLKAQTLSPFLIENINLQSNQTNNNIPNPSINLAFDSSKKGPLKIIK